MYKQVATHVHSSCFVRASCLHDAVIHRGMVQDLSPSLLCHYMNNCLPFPDHNRSSRRAADHHTPWALWEGCVSVYMVCTYAWVPAWVILSGQEKVPSIGSVLSIFSCRHIKYQARDGSLDHLPRRQCHQLVCGHPIVRWIKPFVGQGSGKSF